MFFSGEWEAELEAPLDAAYGALREAMLEKARILNILDEQPSDLFYLAVQVRDVVLIMSRKEQMEQETCERMLLDMLQKVSSHVTRVTTLHRRSDRIRVFDSSHVAALEVTPTDLYLPAMSRPHGDVQDVEEEHYGPLLGIVLEVDKYDRDVLHSLDRLKYFVKRAHDN